MHATSWSESFICTYFAEYAIQESHGGGVDECSWRREEEEDVWAIAERRTEAPLVGLDTR